MDVKQELVASFYGAFSRLDYEQMMDCYADDIIYNDPLVGLIERGEVKAYWKMICANAKALSLKTYDFEEIDDEYVTSRYQVEYYLEATGKKVRYAAKSFMRIAEGKIVEHSDGFRLSTFLGNTYGLAGQLLGWTGYLKKKVQHRYRLLLDQYL